MTHKEKILQYVEFKGLTKTRFCKICGFSNGFLDSKGAIGSDKLVFILENFRDFNIDWLLLDEGEMIKTPDDPTIQEPQESYKNVRCENCKSLERIIESKDETISILKNQLGMDNGGNSKAS